MNRTRYLYLLAIPALVGIASFRDTTPAKSRVVHPPSTRTEAYTPTLDWLTAEVLAGRMTLDAGADRLSAVVPYSGNTPEQHYQYVRDMLGQRVRQGY